jgi:hypothetical protein
MSLGLSNDRGVNEVAICLIDFLDLTGLNILSHITKEVVYSRIISSHIILAVFFYYKKLLIFKELSWLMYKEPRLE